jgi:hypothetical protein
MEHNPLGYKTQMETHYALDISLVGRRFSYLFCELPDVQLCQRPALATVTALPPPNPRNWTRPCQGALWLLGRLWVIN